MTSIDDLSAILRSSAEELLRDVVSLLPRLIGALVILLIGWLIARLIRILVIRGTLLFDRGLRKLPWKVDRTH